MNSQKSVLILDSGNSIIKAKISRRERGEVAFPHALRPLMENEYSNILGRASRRRTSSSRPVSFSVIKVAGWA